LDACKEKKQELKQDPARIIYKIDTAKETPSPAAQRPPIINITDTVASREIIIFVKDSARTSERIGEKLEAIYNKTLPEFFEKNNIRKTGPRMAWFKSSSAPFYFEAGFPVDKKPKKTAKNIFVREVGGDSVVVAHFYGPYQLSYEGYGALKDWLKNNHKKASGAPYEIYVTAPVDSTGKARDPYRVQTDIVMPHH
jgi:effector-binding domain-containing protein